MSFEEGKEVLDGPIDAAQGANPFAITNADIKATGSAPAAQGASAQQDSDIIIQVFHRVSCRPPPVVVEDRTGFRAAAFGLLFSLPRYYTFFPSSLPFPASSSLVVLGIYLASH